MDCPILVWMLSMNREITREEYDTCYKLVEGTLDHVKVRYAPESSDSLLQIVSHMMPLLMMRHRRVPRAMWRDRQTAQGKHWIEQEIAHMGQEKYFRSMIGYSLSHERSLIGMAMVQGAQREVVNVGFAVRRLAVDPPEATVGAYVESMSHKLTPLEVNQLDNTQHGEDILRRLTILLALKAAYIRAIGQPLGFDWSRLEFDVPGARAAGDGSALQGWEFRVFSAALGVVRREGRAGSVLVDAPDPAPVPTLGDGPPGVLDEKYICCVAFFRGGNGPCRYEFQTTSDQLESWVQFINIDQMLKVVPKLSA